MKFHDFNVGLKMQAQPFEVTRDEILSYVQSYDPIHVHHDDEYARSTIYQDLIASGIHMVALILREGIKLFQLERDCFGGSELSKVQWVAPVYAGSILTPSFRIAEMQDRGDANYGIVTVQFTAYNQEHHLVVIGKVNLLIRKEIHGSQKSN
ncbi:MaoC family dehydratase N-terminal domain-containing protein [Paenibacillus sp. sptzw28]|uniref:MaoC family dehydratase n=1 Tax=Paenibacillus sp. sptzw28 TaxID=715179 RepID=UPI001C6E1A9E|nr:MaoC/PaaZ C-terminal domain-containing protein [Paenibacillus sp. sptzw28]QYR20255.1 MaoC family dehydratase N-terminal domain-containing protein [Paenibacillus sp. sptzw28]